MSIRITIAIPPLLYPLPWKSGPFRNAFRCKTNRLQPRPCGVRQFWNCSSGQYSAGEITDLFQVLLAYQQSEPRKQEVSSGIVNDVDLAGIEAGLQLRQRDIELEDA